MTGIPPLLPAISVIAVSLRQNASGLERLLERIGQQSFPEAHREVIIPDRRDSPPGDYVTAPVFATVEVATSRAKGGLIVFLDEDCRPATDFLAELHSLAERHPRIGVFGCDVGIQPDRPLPACPDQWQRHAGINRVRRPIWANELSSTQAIPTAPGLAVRRDVLARAFQEASNNRLCENSISNPFARFNLLATRMVHAAIRLGLGVGVFPSPRLDRVADDRLLSPANLLQLVEQTRLAHVCLELADGQPSVVFQKSKGRRLADWIDRLALSPWQRDLLSARDRGEARAVACHQTHEA